MNTSAKGEPIIVVSRAAPIPVAEAFTGSGPAFLYPYKDRYITRAPDSIRALDGLFAFLKMPSDVTHWAIVSQNGRGVPLTAKSIAEAVAKIDLEALERRIRGEPEPKPPKPQPKQKPQGTGQRVNKGRTFRYRGVFIYQITPKRARALNAPNYIGCDRMNARVANAGTLRAVCQKIDAQLAPFEKRGNV